jgi:hypothetical protein
MNDTPSGHPADLATRHHLRKTLLFLAEMVYGRPVHCISATNSPLGEVRQLRNPTVDLAATIQPAPALRREMLVWCRSRQRPLILARVRVPTEGFCELLADVAFSEGASAALLNDMRIALFDQSRRYLIPPNVGEVLLRMSPEGLIPTMTEPAPRSACARAIFEAESRLSAFIWS